MSRLDELIGKLCPHGVEFKPLGECIRQNVGGGTPRKSRTDYWNGSIPWASVKDLVKHDMYLPDTQDYITEKGLANSPSNLIAAGAIVVATRISPGKMLIARKDVAINQDLRGLTLKDSLDSKYLVYYFQTLRIEGKGTTVKGISTQELENIKIPVPPLPVQREIVRILDNFTELTAELTAEHTARKKQYEYYRNTLLNFSDDSSVQWLTLGEIGRVSMCKRIMKAETSPDGDVPFFKIGTFGKEPDAYISQEKVEEYRKAYSFPKKGDVLISAAGTIGRTVIYDGEPAYYQDSNIVWIDNDESKVSNKYLYYYYTMKPWFVSTGGTIARLYNHNIIKAKIPVPPFEDQERIVAILDRFDALCNDLTSGLPAEIEARRKQYESYRDRLFTL